MKRIECFYSCWFFFVCLAMFAFDLLIIRNILIKNKSICIPYIKDNFVFPVFEEDMSHIGSNKGTRGITRMA
jgi:hypothetical protein